MRQRIDFKQDMQFHLFHLSLCLPLVTSQLVNGQQQREGVFRHGLRGLGPRRRGRRHGAAGLPGAGRLRGSHEERKSECIGQTSFGRGTVAKENWFSFEM